MAGASAGVFLPAAAKSGLTAVYSMHINFAAIGAQWYNLSLVGHTNAQCRRGHNVLQSASLRDGNRCTRRLVGRQVYLDGRVHGNGCRGQTTIRSTRDTISGTNDADLIFEQCSSQRQCNSKLCVIIAVIPPNTFSSNTPNRTRHKPSDLT